MTDNAPTVTICDEDGCHVVIPADIEHRRAHRAGHRHDTKVIEAIRRDHRELTTTNDALRSEIAALRAELHREIDNIDIPAPVAPIAIVDTADLEPLDEDEDDDQDDQPTSTYADDTTNATVAMDPADLGYPLAIDRDDDPAPATRVDMYGQPIR